MRGQGGGVNGDKLTTKKTHEDWRLWEDFIKGLMNKGKFQYRLRLDCS